MTREEFRVLVEEKGPVILDGGTGSCLRKMGMPVGVSTEQWVYEHPEEIARLQREYADAGSMVIYAPTFGANRETLKGMGLEANVEILNRELVKRTKENVGDRVLIAGDMSTTGKGLEGNVCSASVHDHHHVEVFLDDGLGNIKDVNFMVRKICTYLCDDAYGVFSYYGDNNFIHGNFPPCVVPSAYCDPDPSGLRSLPEHMDPGER